MSRIGKRKLNIPEGVMVSVAGNTVSVKGLKGELSMQKRLEIDVVVKDQEGRVILLSEDAKGLGSRYNIKVGKKLKLTVAFDEYMSILAVMIC